MFGLCFLSLAGRSKKTISEAGGSFQVVWEAKMGCRAH